MADVTLGPLDELQDIVDAFEAVLKKATDGDRIILSKSDATTLLQTISELWDENEESAKSRKPIFLHVSQPHQEAYLQPAAIAIVACDKGGNAVLNMVNGSNLQIEALQWQVMKKMFHQSVLLLEVPSTGGMVKA